MKRIVIILVLFLLAGCGPKLDGDAQLATQFLEDKGYSIRSYEGNELFIFDKNDLLDQPYNMVWAVQPVKPDPYIGKEISRVIFVVKNHPLSKIYGPQKGFSSKVEISVFIFEGKIIGGTSLPIGRGIAGSPHSLEGLTAEEFLGEEYKEWWTKWEERSSDTGK